MKNMKILMLLVCFPLIGLTQAVNVPFTYQGELVVNGSPANDTYDMSFDAYDVAGGGPSLLFFGADIHAGVVVTNGIFTVSNVDFGNLIFSSGTDVWIELAVKTTSSGTYSTLSPRQKITSVPYAIKSDFSNNATNATNATSSLKANDLNISGAIASDVLVYDGTNWKTGGVSIRVRSDGVSVGPQSPLNGDVVALDVNSDGNASQDDPLRVRKNGAIKFYVDSNGGASVGSWNTPEADGLRVKGNTKLESELLVQGKMKQNFASTGLVKYMMYIQCFNNQAAFLREVNNTERTLAGTGLFAENVNINGTCSIAFPDDISSSFWQATATNDNVNATCRISGVSGGKPAMRCETRDASGTLMNATFMLIVY